MANPQPDKFTRISNEILEVLAKVSLNGTQRRIIDVVMRFTYGFNRKEHAISLSFLLNAMNMKDSQKKQVKRELDKLIEINILVENKKPTENTTRILSFNKNYDEWTIKTSGLIRPVDELDHSPVVELDYSTVDELDHTSVDYLDHSPVVELDHQERKVLKKDLNTSLKKEEERKENPASSINPVEKIYQDNIGLITPIIYQSIIHWLNDGIEEALIIRYIEVAVKRNKRSWQYIEKMIKGNLESNIKTLEQYEAMCNESKSRTNSSSNNEDPFIKFGREKGWIV